MLSINKVHIIGNLTRDPEIKDTQNGRLARLGVATNRRYRDKDSGQMVDAPQYHDVVVFQDRLIDVIENYCVKGTQVSIEGTLEHRTYEDKDGIKRKVTEIVIRPFSGEFQLGNRAGNDDGDSDRGGSRGGGRDDDRGGSRGGGGRGGYDNDRGGNDRGGSRGNDRDSGGRGGYDDMDDDIPF
jgi:single-strand DNA-binding protein